MQGECIPDDHNVARLCNRATSLDEENNPTAEAFKLRSDELYLSVNWIEFLNLANAAQAIAELQRVYASKLTVSKRARIATLNVRRVREHVRSGAHRAIRVLHEPEERDRSHSGMHDIPKHDDALLVGELIAEVVEKLYPGLAK